MFNRKYILLFLLICVIYNSNLQYQMIGDAFGAATIPFAIIQYHTVTLDAYLPLILASTSTPAVPSVCVIGGHIYSSYPVVLPILITPVYAFLYPFMELCNAPLSPLDPKFLFVVIFMQKTAASLVTSLSAVLLFTALEKKFSQATVYTGTFIYAFCTLTWPISSQMLWQQGAIELFVAGILLVLLFSDFSISPIRGVFLGILCGLLIFARPSDSFLIIPVLLVIFPHINRIIGFGLGFLISGLPFFWYNYSRFNSVFGGYGNLIDQITVNSSDIIHVVALCISPSRGLFIYSPVLLLIIPGLYILYRQSTTREEKKFSQGIVIAVIGSLLLYGFFDDWHGGASFGPRFLTGMLPYLVYVLCFFLETLYNSKSLETWTKCGFFLLFIMMTISLFVQMVGAYHMNNGDWNGKFDLRSDENVWDIYNSQILYTFRAGPNLWYLDGRYERILSNLSQNMSRAQEHHTTSPRISRQQGIT